MINYAWMGYAPVPDKNTFPVDHYPDKIIPYGDCFLSSFTLKPYAYAETKTGFFRRKHNATIIEQITQAQFERAKLLLSTFTTLSNTNGDHTAFSRLKKTSPQAGLTRGSKRTFSTSQEKIASILEKYKNGVLA